MIEACSKDNLQEWLALRALLFDDSTREELVADSHDFLSKPEQYCQYLYRAENGEAVAFVEASIRSDYVNGTEASPVAFLEGIYVDADFRRQNIAKALVDKVTEWALAKGMKEFASDAYLDNLTSHAMHKALGFEETERVVYFKKSLT